MEPLMNQRARSVRNHCLSPARARVAIDAPLGPDDLWLGCFPNFRHFRPMSNSCARSVAQVASAIAETSMTLPTPWGTPLPVGRSSANLWLTI